MSFTVQNDEGTVAGANAYMSITEVDDYFSDRNITTWTGADAIKQAAIIKATDYIDRTFKFIGRMRNSDQSTKWPRSDAYTEDNRLISNIPIEIKEACAEYALRSLSTELSPDIDFDSSGGVYKSKSESVAPIKESVTFSHISSTKIFPGADNILKELIMSDASGDIIRG